MYWAETISHTQSQAKGKKKDGNEKHEIFSDMLIEVYHCFLNVFTLCNICLKCSQTLICIPNKKKDMATEI